MKDQRLRYRPLEITALGSVVLGPRKPPGADPLSRSSSSVEPPYLGSQGFLVPDLTFELEGCTLIVDAKYKRHWEELRQRPWAAMEDVPREEHRQDLLQILAYANLAETTLAVCCLIYPCSSATWESLREQRRLFHEAEMLFRSRRILIWLTAVPMCTNAEPITGPLVGEIRNIARALVQ